MTYSSRSQPGYRGKQGCHLKVKGVPPISKINSLIDIFLHLGVRKILNNQASMPLDQKKCWKALSYRLLIQMVTRHLKAFTSYLKECVGSYWYLRSLNLQFWPLVDQKTTTRASLCNNWCLFWFQREATLVHIINIYSVYTFESTKTDHFKRGCNIVWERVEKHISDFNTIRSVLHFPNLN